MVLLCLWYAKHRHDTLAHYRQKAPAIALYRVASHVVEQLEAAVQGIEGRSRTHCWMHRQCATQNGDDLVFPHAAG
jgi:hypothetical protein